MIVLAVLRALSVLADAASTPIYVSLIGALVALAGTAAAIIQTARVSRSQDRKADRDDFVVLQASWQAEIGRIGQDNERLRRDRAEDHRRIRNLEEEVAAGRRREVDLMQRLGMAPRPSESRDRSTDDG